MEQDPTTKLLAFWRRGLDDRSEGLFIDAYDQLSTMLRELVAQDVSTSWSTAATKADLPGLMVTNDVGLAILYFRVADAGLEIGGELYPTRQTPISEVSFVEKTAASETVAVVGGGSPITPRLRHWDFHWAGSRKSLAIEYWVPQQLQTVDQSELRRTLDLHEGQRALAHTLAERAGWPLPRP